MAVVNGLRTWRELNDVLRNTSEQECKVLLTQEQKGKKRPSVLLRIYSRYSVLRKERELEELFIKKAAK